MGRSKFPGKPPKTVTRKRIKVLGRPETTQTDPVTVVAAENIYYGLSLFNETFGDNEKEHPPFHGFSSKEAKLSVCYVKTQQRDTEVPEQPLKKSPSKCRKNIKDIKNPPLDEENVRDASLYKSGSNRIRISRDSLGKTESDEARRVCRMKNRRSKIAGTESLNLSKAPVLKPVNNILERHQRTRQLRNSTAKRLLQRAKSSGSVNTRNGTGSTGDKIGTVRKFVLPVRSVHSSRVIKPNKRFIEELEETCIPESSESLNEKYHKKAKVLPDRTGGEEVVDKDMRKPKKTVQNVTANSNISNHTVTTADNELKKPQVSTCKNKSSVKSSHVSPSTAQDPIPQLSKSNTCTSSKQTLIPAKVPPDSSTTNSESSRVQTRSGTLSAAVNSPSPKVASEPVHNSTDNMPALEDVPSLKESIDNISDKSVSTSNSQSLDTESNLSESGSEHSDHSEDEQSEWSGMKLNGGKVILRKARLKLDNRTSGGAEGPFSNSNAHSNSSGSSNPGLAATVKCGVCGAVRFYRFVKQARKFGIHSCESCRKFISKMIKRQACTKSTNNALPVLQCHKGDGLCLVPPVVRSQQWNLMRCVYKARCPACWLKMCLKCYNIPAALRAGLNLLLPPLMRDPLAVPVSVPMSVCQEESEGQMQRLTGCKLGWPAEDSRDRSLFRSATNWNGLDMLGQKTSHQNAVPGALGKLKKFDYPISVSPSKKRRKDNRIKVRKKVKNPSLDPSTTDQFSQPVRQRLELKGPRVKHVCRSASVALGQPIATFPSSEGKEDIVESGKNIPRLPKDEEKTEEIKKVEEVSKEKEIIKAYQEETNNQVQQPSQKRVKVQGQQNPSTLNLPVIRSLPKPVVDEVHTVSIDFWEQYDPAEVGAKGFALIGSEAFHIPAICYLCGSAGKEPLIHCQCCCEPYHAFCLEPSEWNACAQPNWCCPRCTICQTCHLRSGPKLSCIRCRQSFHHSCLSKSGISTRLYSPDRPYVCHSCIKCKSCGSEGVSVHVGNLPLCSMCFKLRQRGNYCPLCQRCYDENDFDTKMMECNECSCWVHARCEGLSDERYEILSYLPDSIEFICRQCSPDPNSIWRNAVEAELKAGFIGVIKSLSKNRKACIALKWSPRKECLCRPISSVRKLDFSDEKLEVCVINGKEVINRFDDYDECNSERSTDADSNLSGNLKSDNSSKSDFETDDQPTDPPKRGLRRLRQKFHLKECSVRVKNCLSKEGQDIFDGKDSAVDIETTRGSVIENKECLCLEQQIIARPSPTLMSVKRKVNGNEYGSLLQFHCDMEHVINRASNEDLVEAYHKILCEVFPWFHPKHSKITSSTGGLSTPTKESYSKDSENFLAKLDDSILETWKEEVLRAPKAIAAKSGNLYQNINAQDSRSCCLCKGLGDGYSTREGRLLYCGQNEWVHANCALWSNEVFEEIDGSLQNVHSAISRGRLIRCTECGKKGASVGCCSKNCNGTYHYPCARNIDLAFNDDKTVFCTSHLSNCSDKTPQSEEDFDLKRPVYVELDRKKKKYAEPNKVKVMIGSLTIDCLGTIVPEFSDTIEKIVPSDYKCSRLYWSTINPLKIVKYYVRTFVQIYVPEAAVDMENNVTIDHSAEREAESDTEKSVAVKQTLDTLVDSVCNKEADENLAEQNNTDLLPPELKEAIFEDLPHDLLDGISMQDIFPKMTYEDFLAMDLKTDGGFGTDLLKDEILPTEVDEMIKPTENKVSKMDPSMPELGPQNDFWLHLEAKSSVQDIVDDLFNSKNQKLGGRELKRSKSEVMSNNSVVVGGPRHHQRSCSLTWSYKLDGTYGPTMKRRKLPKNLNSTRSEAAVTVVESQNERTPMLHELRIPESIMLTVGRASTPSIISESVRELKYCIEDSGVTTRRTSPRDDGKEHKRLLWHARQHPRILQVDGTADTGSASECSSPEYTAEDRVPPLHSLDAIVRIPQVDGANDDSSCDSGKFDTGASLYKYASRFSKLNRVPRKEDGKELVEKFNQSDAVSFKIPQLDGADDVSSDDECSSPHSQVPNELGTSLSKKYLPIPDPVDQPVTCKRCRCTYRTQDSYNRHLATCDIMTTSDSDSETMDNKLTSPDSRFSPSIGSSIESPQFITMSPSEGHTLSSEYSDIQATSPVEASVPSPHPGIQIEPIAQAIMTPQIHTHATVETVHQTVLTSNDMIVQTQYTRTTTTLPNATVLPQQPESTVQITEITDRPLISRDSVTSITQSAINVPLTSPDSTSSQTIPSPQVSPTFSSTGVQTSANEAGVNPGVQQAKLLKPKSPRTPKPRAKGIKPNILRTSNVPQSSHVRFQTIQNNTPIIQLQQAQRATGPTVILQQVPQPNLMSAYVEAMQQQQQHQHQHHQQSAQNLQYVATIGGQHETGYKPQFIAANSLVPGAYIQASSDNLLTLQNGGISVLPNVQIAQPQPTVLGTIIQQQPSAIQCGVISSEQLVLSSTPALEMFTDSTGSMFVHSQPMYYGLETIVSNTVMSSSQFVAGAVPQVLASSYQTTTQVFQASKLMEPIVDVQSVPNVPNVPSVQTVQSVPGVPGSYVVVNQPPPPIAEPSNSQITISANPEQAFAPANCNPIQHGPCLQIADPVQPIQVPQIPPIVSSAVSPSDMLVGCKQQQQTSTTIPRVAVRPSPVSHTSVQPLQQIQSMQPLHQGPWRITEPLFASEQPISNNIRPYFDSKHVSENTSMIKSSISSKMPPLPSHCVPQRNNNNITVNKMNHNDVNNVHTSYVNTMSNNSVGSCIVNSNSSNGHCINVNMMNTNNVNQINLNVCTTNKITMPVSNAPTSRPMNRVLPMQAITSKPEPAEQMRKPDIAVEEPTKLNVQISKRRDDMIVEPVKEPDASTNDLSNSDAMAFDIETMNKMKENLKLELDKEKLQNKSLKIVFQKQLQDGSYKITQNMKAVSQNKRTPQITSVEILSPREAAKITSLQLSPLKNFALKSSKMESKPSSLDNKMDSPKPRPPPIAVKKPRIVSKILKPPNNNPSKLMVKKSISKRPSMMYEIKSQDGFTHVASSMSEVWDKVFEAVQSARRAHNLPPLPHNPLTENLGLENNATVYLVEQLPGVNRCTKYKPKLHNLKPPKPSEIENDLLTECDSGAARAESFRGRKVHDMFSWLASRHRQQPKMIAISENESRRAASTNLPMAMRFRILKETSKESVGVYHSHIHGRGLFCLRDIEAGEMVIEYAGEVIRASLTDKREKYYDSKNIGCYMFKIDDHLVVDATMKGNAARFINHSCEPNCYSRVVDILGKKHILIFALRRIVQGEELTYDYKFPFEDIKIPCTCGSRRCRKYLN
ncbi:histone-lysine N-methyltransferase trithorax [Neodiprion fabricii]|uniref:histone-lysine N-methyltransferase trithorax n=1 Tax=Neodiprion fabricii TaxID=2872261 RepID=UPI001ED92B04|nr:histone-lysine N-methyltransferase trithorax [Neodiprion fabricii]